jgi:hypothetical protein
MQDQNFSDPLSRSIEKEIKIESVVVEIGLINWRVYFVVSKNRQKINVKLI